MILQKSIFKGAETRILKTTKSHSLAYGNIGNSIEIYEIDIHSNATFELVTNLQKLVILPIVGSCTISINNTQHETIHYEQVLTIGTQNKFNKISFSNTIKASIKVLLINFAEYFLPDLENKIALNNILFTKKNHWAEITALDFIKIGVFESRFEDELICENQHKFLNLTLNGSFEINGRLLNQGDALYLTEKHLGFEALSENSILLSIKIK